METRVAPRVDQPEEGFYRTRLVKNGVWVPVKITYGPPRDPDTGETLDRSWRWTALRAGEEVDVFDVWPGCSGAPITEEEYEFQLADAAWARKYAPIDPKANPRKAVDLNAMAPIKF